MATVSVRYIVDDVDAAIAFYCRLLDFHEEMHPAPTFAMLTPETSGSYSAHRVGRAAAASPCQPAPHRNPLDGTGSRWKSPILPAQSTRCASRVCTSATTS